MKFIGFYDYTVVLTYVSLVSALVGVAPDSKSFYGDGAYSLMRKIAFFLADEESDANFYDYLNDIIVNGSDHSDAYLNLISKLLAFIAPRVRINRFSALIPYIFEQASKLTAAGVVKFVFGLFWGAMVCAGCV